MNLPRQLAELKTQSLGLADNERAELACRLAKQFEKAGEYEAACEALGEFWPETSRPPKVEGLAELTKAQVLLRAGALAGWSGGADQIEGTQETAKNLITRSLEIFETHGLNDKASEARGDLALCYWREGAYDEARINLEKALGLLGTEASELRAVLLIRAGLVETWTQQLERAMRFYDEAAPLVDRSEDHALKGTFHNEYGLVFRRLAAPENREDYLDRALIEYTAASFHFDQARNYRYLARVQMNLGFLYFTIGRYKDAHLHLDRARNLFVDMKDIGTVAQVDETRARTLLAEGRILEADRMIRAAVKVLERGDQQAVLAEALTTHGIILARLGTYPRAKTVLERAVEIAQTTGDLEGAGRAKLSIIEELAENTHPTDLVATYRLAIELLKNSQNPSTGRRLITCAETVLTVLEQAESNQQSTLPSWEGFSFKKWVHESEREVLERALRDAGGSVTRAARLLGFKHHQSLISLINARHKELFKSRSAPRKRRRHLFSEPRVMKKKSFDFRPKPRMSQISILHVEDNKLVADLVQDALTDEDMHVESVADGTNALEALKGDTRYDVIILDNDLPGLSGLELILRVRSLPHRRQTPIIMLSGDDCEREAWRAGVNAFLRKPKGVDKVPSTIARLLKQRKAKRSQDRVIKPFVS